MSSRASGRRRRSAKPRADLKRKTMTDPKVPRAWRGWFANERRQRGNSAYCWRNPPGYEAGHRRGRPFWRFGDDGGPLHWETRLDNHTGGIFEFGRRPRTRRPRPLPG